MMNPVNKIHFNSSTGVSLNDRFTIMSKVSPQDKGAAPLGLSVGGQGVSSGLRRRANSVDSIPSRGSLANRAFVSQLDRRHMGGQHSTLRLRNRNIKSGRQRLNRNNFGSRGQLRRAAGNTLTLAGGSRRMLRSNSLSDIATMNADFFERQSPLKGNSQGGLAGRLGTNGRLGRSRSRAGRSQQRNQSRNRSRSNSGIRGGGGGGGIGRASRSRSRNNPVANGRARSRSATANSNGRYYNNGLDGRIGRGRGGRPMQRRNSYMPRSVSRSSSVNGRLGNNRTGRPMSGGRGGFRGGRIGKRGMRRGGAYGGGGFVGRNGNTGGRPGRTLQRGRGGSRGRGGAPNGGIQRGRSRSRGRAPSQGRGRSAQRNGRNASRGRFPSSGPQKSKEQLDQELDTYMANTKSSLDKEMDEYMNAMHSSTI